MRVLIASPASAERLALDALLCADGHEVSSVADCDAAIAVAAASHPDVIIAEAHWPRIDALARLRELSGHAARTILLCSRSSRVLEGLDVICLIKPIDLVRLERHLAAVPRVA